MKTSRQRGLFGSALPHALLLVALVFPAARLSAHDIPRDVTVQAFAKPEGQTLRLLMRVPLKAIMDIEFPRRERDYVDLSRVDQALRDAATVWLSNKIEIYEGDTRLENPRIVSTRMSLESDRSFGAYDDALAHVTGPTLPADTTIFWEQGLLDVLFALRCDGLRQKAAVRGRVAILLPCHRVDRC